MQRFLHKVVSHHHRQPNLSGFNNSHHRVYNHTSSSGTAHIHTPKPSPQGHRIPSSFTTHLLHRFHSWHRILSQPMLALHSRNALPRISLLDCKLRLPAFHFCVQRFSFSRNYDFYRRRWRSWFDMLTPNDVVLGLITANTTIFLLWKITDKKFMINNFTISLDNIDSRRFHTVITSVFSHADSWHITSNMFGLYIFGMKVGTLFGPGFLWRFYLLGAVGGSITTLSYLLYQAFMAERSKKELGIIKRSKDLALGASGPVYAVMLLDIFLFPTTIIFFDIFKFLIPVPTIILGTFLIGNDMLRISKGDSSISGAAHLGGATTAALAWAVLQLGRFR